MDVFDAESNFEVASEFQTALDEDSEIMDDVNEVSQLKTLTEEIERKRKQFETSQTRSLERILTEVQEQMSSLQSSHSHQSEELHVCDIWSP